MRNNKKAFFLYVKLTYYHFKLDFQKVDQHTGGTWLINWKAWNSPVEYPSRECKHGLKGSEGNMFKS